MLGVAGNFFICFALLLNTAIILFKFKDRSAKIAEFASALFISASMLALIFGFVSSDFLLRNVFVNSSSINPLMYKIAASWSSHEGSMLLFITFLSIFSSSAYFCLPDLPLKRKVNILQKLIISAMLISLWSGANPFGLNSFVPHEGLGLNPLLQDVALLYHPPILYLGYACCFIIFSYCSLIFLDQGNNIVYLRNLLMLSRLTLMLLTLGISLGSWWAYRELGWGGFWFFDPVENISLLPWICAIAFHHSLLSSIKYAAFKKWTIFWGSLAYPLVLGGMFLVRSNFLISVHSFALDVSKALFLGIIAAISLIIALKGCRRYPSDLVYLRFFSKAHAIVISNILWALALVSIIFSLLLPIIFHIIYDLDLALEAGYFKLTLLPIAILMNIIIGPSVYRKLSAVSYIICIGCSMTFLVMLIYYFNIRVLITICAIFSATFLLLTTAFEFFYKSKTLLTPLQQPVKSGGSAMLLGHFAYGILTLSIALNSSLEKEVDLIGEKHAAVEMDNFHIKLEDIKYSYGPNYLRQIAQIKIEDKKSGFIIALAPENRWYTIENKMTAESSIYSFVNYDLYAVLNRIQGNKVHLKIYYRPYISFVWLASCLMVISFAASIFQGYRTRRITLRNEQNK